jgi:hypothetical protein
VNREGSSQEVSKQEFLPTSSFFIPTLYPYVVALTVFRFVAVRFRVRGCFWVVLVLLAADAACCSAGLDAGFFRLASRFLSLLRK